MDHDVLKQHARNCQPGSTRNKMSFRCWIWTHNLKFLRWFCKKQNVRIFRSPLSSWVFIMTMGMTIIMREKIKARQQPSYSNTPMIRNNQRVHPWYETIKGWVVHQMRCLLFNSCQCLCFLFTTFLPWWPSIFLHAHGETDLVLPGSQFLACWFNTSWSMEAITTFWV